MLNTKFIIYDKMRFYSDIYFLNSDFEVVFLPQFCKQCYH